MNDFQLQTEITDELRKRLELYSEKSKIELEIDIFKRKIRNKKDIFLNVSALLVSFQALLNFFFSYPFDYVFFSIFGVLNLIQAYLLFSRLRKLERKLENWKETASELEYK